MTVRTEMLTVVDLPAMFNKAIDSRYRQEK